MTRSAARGRSARVFLAVRAGRWLALAASPVFAGMVWLSATDPGPMALCGSGPGRLPVDGMPAMYALMSVFHLPSWLRLRKPAVRS